MLFQKFFISLLQSSEDVEVFTPELRGDEDKLENSYRFVCAHAGQFQCSLTSLVFVMAGEGEVLYGVESWDPCQLDGLGQMQPAGPLYNIDCFNGSLSGLHFPHCEILSEKNKDSLAVAHFTGGNVETMKPLKVTETHVMIDIRDLSLFGLLKRMFFPHSPVIAQVLFFERLLYAGQKENILDVHLLPWNVRLSKVSFFSHRDSEHIITSSKCFLIPGSEYSLCCEAEGTSVQPTTERFDCNFGPNFHPTFEVFVNLNTVNLRLRLLDSEGREIWNRRIVLIYSISTVFFKSIYLSNNLLLISSVMIADAYSKVHAAEPRQEKMRLLLDVLDSGGAVVKAEFCRLLKEKEHYLVD
uniref:FIIND domain-containing protein n=1 Tax=Sinocyclocheilus rhinocerous TaxID=307959 RepID=A0A673KDD9_9TELE